MANITLLGASYTDVPAVDLPQTGGGTVRFYENGGSSGYTRTTICAEQTVVSTSPPEGDTDMLLLTSTDDLIEGDYYLVTVNGTERVQTAVRNNYVLYLADITDAWWDGNRMVIMASGDIYFCPWAAGTYTVKVEHLELDGSGGGGSSATLITKNITANGTYSAEDDDADGYSSVTVNVPSGGGTDFIVTLSYNSQTDMWEPDCTYSTLYTAYDAGKTIAWVPDDSVSTAYGNYSSVANGFEYDVLEYHDDTDGEGFIFHGHLFDSTGVTDYGRRDIFYITYDADATASDVANGKVFYNANGRQTGTASGGGSSKNVQTAQSTTRRNNTALGSITSLTCSTAGTYDVYWTCARSNTSQTWGSQLYINGTAYGTENTTWTNNVQNNHLTGVVLSANDTVAVYGRSRSGYYIYAPQLTIVQTA